MIDTRKVGKLTLLVILVTLASKLLGFIRESVIASRFGASHETDAYVIAVTVYTIIFVVFWESINNAFVPLFIQVSKRDEKKGNNFASNIILQITIITTVIVIIGEFFMKIIIAVIAPGFSKETAILAQSYTRITLPVLIITGISIIVGGILQAKKKFLPQALMGIPNHIIVIMMLLLSGSIIGVEGLVVLTAVGTAIQIMVQLPFLKSTGFRFSPKIGKGTVEYKLFYSAIVPICISTSARQINVMVDRALASYTGYGNISILNYANTLNIAVIGLFITTITTILYPYMADEKQGNRNLSDSISGFLYKLLIIVLPVTVIVCTLNNEIVSVIYERGSFTHQNAVSTSSVFMFYSLSLIPYAVTDMLNKHFYILGNNKVPMKVGIVSILTNLVFDFIFIRPMGISGLALSTSISSFIAMIITIIYLKHKYDVNIRTMLSKSLPLIIGGIIMMVVMVLVEMNMSGNIITKYPVLNSIIIAVVCSIVGILSYGAVIYFNKVGFNKTRRQDL